MLYGVISEEKTVPSEKKSQYNGSSITPIIIILPFPYSNPLKILASQPRTSQNMLMVWPKAWNTLLPNK